MLDPDFPLDEVQEIGIRLANSGAILPAYIPPEVGEFDVSSIIYEQSIEGLEFVVHLDRNLTSRLAKIAKSVSLIDRKWPENLAVDLMAFCQSMNWDIEPAVSYHELADSIGDQAAKKELAFFDLANSSNANAWIELAQGRTDLILFPTNEFDRSNLTGDLTFPLHRWNRNYVVALKMAAIDFEAIPNIEKWQKLARWMFEDFNFAGPASAYALLYFSTHVANGGLLKNLRGADDQKALRGIRNAAWDITYLSRMVELATVHKGLGKRHLFASGDKKLTSISRVVLQDQTDPQALHNAIAPWWGERAAEHLVDEIISYVTQISKPEWQTKKLPKSISDFIFDGEEEVRQERAKLTGVVVH